MRPCLSKQRWVEPQDLLLKRFWAAVVIEPVRHERCAHVIAHLHEGMKVDQLELIWNDQLRFTLRAEGSLTKIKPTEHYAEDSDAAAEDDNARLDADQRLMVAALRQLIADLSRVLSATDAV